ncbi:MAG: hypothetical protein FWD53_03925, partial [Phycisphaerales bacterium]|nr:hypothetical protein [Phycisphaerales bacterium]
MNIKTLRTLTAKELRQNLIYVALIYALITPFVIINCLDMKLEPINILRDTGLQFLIILSCILAGLVIGIVQPLADIHFDRWSFMMHRPVPRHHMFLARILAGLALYFLAIGLPLLTLIIIAATPLGGIYFIWQFALPSLAAFLLGITWYTAALLVSDRYALFYGSRVLPLILAFVAAVAMASQTFTVTLLITLALTALLATAALGSFLTRGYSLTPSKPLHATLILTFLLCFTFLLYPPLTAKRTSLHQWRPYPQFYPPLPFAITRYTLSPEGTLALVKTDVEQNIAFDAKNTRTYFDLNGAVLPAPNEAGCNSTHHGRIYLDTHLDRYRTYKENFMHLRPLITEITSFQLSERDEYPPRTERWFFNNTRNLFIIFHETQLPSPDNLRPGRTITQRQGTFGQTGFIHAGTRPQPFTNLIKHFSGRHLATNKNLYRIDFRDRQLTILFTAPEGEHIIDLSPYGNTHQDNIKDFYIATNKNLYRVTHDGQIQNQFPITHDLQRYYLSISYFPDNDRWAINYLPFNFFSPHSTQFWEFYNNAGKLLESHELPMIKIINPPPPT